ncbi:MAG: peptidase M50 [Planctomycetota bacterium]
MGVSMINPDLRRKIKVRMRPDLVITKQQYGGQTYFIVKDPVALRYYRFREEELFLLQQFDGFNTLDDIRHEFVERFRPQRISVVELEKFAGQLLQAGIATADTPQMGQRLFERYQEKRNQKIKQFFLNILYIKIPVFDPEKLLERMLPFTRFFFTIPFFTLALLFGLSSLLLVLVNWEEFVSKLPSYHEFFTWRNILYFWCTLGLVKVIHEFGHGLSCKRFGGEVHEMGFLVLVLTPCLYCNVTDAWMLPNKWHRAIIGAAGIYVELILSSIFVWVWWYTEPGLLNTLSLSIIFICSVSTVLFNANPLLRFDGYYILSDLIEIPNLRERSNKYLGNVASKVFFGTEAVADPYMPKRRKWFFIVYSIAAYVYRWVVTVGILWFLYTFLKPYKLGMLSAMLATMAAFTLFVLPAYRVLKMLGQRWRSMKVNKLRMSLAIATTVAVVALILLIPYPMRIDVPMILQPRAATTIFVQVPGILKRLDVRDGEKVTGGATLAVLEDPEVVKLYQEARQEQEMSDKAARAFRAKGDLARAREAQMRTQIALEKQQSLRQELDKLTIKVPPGCPRNCLLAAEGRSPRRPSSREKPLPGRRSHRLGSLLSSSSIPIRRCCTKDKRFGVKLAGMSAKSLRGKSPDRNGELEQLPPFQQMGRSRHHDRAEGKSTAGKTLGEIVFGPSSGSQPGWHAGSGRPRIGAY